MNTRENVSRFLDTQSIGPESCRHYRSILLEFEESLYGRMSVTDQAGTVPLREWLKQETQRLSLRNVICRIRVIARYLKWRTAEGGCSHPLLELRAQYGGHLGPIVCALLESDYESALQRLKPLSEWGSVLGPMMCEHVARMQSLGYRYEARMGDLRYFDRFLQQHPDLATAKLPQLLDAWSKESNRIRHQFRVQQCGLILSRALRRKDPAVSIMPVAAGLYSRTVEQERRPYVFTEAEIRALLDAARAFPSPRSPLRPIALHAMITLAYCAGLRVGEIAALRLRDLDLKSGLLEVRETKFFKSRRLPLAPSALNVLRAYVADRAASGAPVEEDAPMWWASLLRCGYSRKTIKELLRCVMRRAGLKTEHGRQGPRLHDIRHTFVAHRMTQWYRDGVNPQAHLPYLATYLGHKDIGSTLAYLHSTPELLRQASERYRQHSVDVLRAQGDAS